MFANIRRHQKWLWYLIAGAVIISFTWYLNPNQQGGGGSGGNATVGTINGRPISQGEYLEAQKETQLQYFLRNGTWFGSDDYSRQDQDYLTRETKNRLFLKEKIRQHNIHVSPGEIADWIRDAFGRERPFQAADYERFLKERLEPQGVRERDFERFVSTDVAISHLINVAGVAGRLVTPQEAEAQYRRENEQISSQMVLFSVSNYLSKVQMDANAVLTYYTNSMANFREPEKIKLAYVEFSASNYFPQAEQKLATITNLNQQIDSMYMQRGEKFFTDTNGVQLSAEAAKKKLRDEYLNTIALVEAQKTATDFIETMMTNTTKSITNLQSLAQLRGLTVKTTEPFAQYESPKGLDLPERASQVVFQLTATEPFVEEPIRGDDAIYVVGLSERIASHNPAFDKVRERVETDYKREEAEKLLFEDARSFHTKLTNSIASGKTFEAAATELGNKPMNLEPFSRASRTIAGLDPSIDPGMIKAAAFSMKPGETSSFRPSRNGGFILHLTKTVPVEDSIVRLAMPDYLKGLQQAGQSGAFQEWFSKEMQGAKITLITDREEAEGATKTQ